MRRCRVPGCTPMEVVKTRTPKNPPTVVTVGVQGRTCGRSEKITMGAQMARMG